MISRLEAMLDQGRDDAMLRFGLGSAYFNEGEMDKAAEHLRACVEQDASYSAAYKLLGKALFQAGDLEGARPVLEQGLTIAETAGDKQSAREMAVFLKKIDKEKTG